MNFIHLYSPYGKLTSKFLREPNKNDSPKIA